MTQCQPTGANRPPARDLAGGVILMAPPWALFGRPSIQLATLKAFLCSRIPDLAVTACHWHLRIAADIGYAAYDAVSRHTWTAESVYAALLFPQRAEPLARFFHRQAPAGARTVDFGALTAAVGRCSHDLIHGIDWGRFRLAGFSIGLCQLTAALYFIRQIKAIRPELPTVIGGSAITEETARGLLQRFPDIDFAVCGEGENPLAELIRFQENARASLQNLPAGVLRAAAGDAPLAFNQIDDVNCLPTPDFSDYFALLDSLPAERRFFPTLALEMSRGCFRQQAPNGGCAFCNLNRQWRGFRSKAAEKIIAETRHIIRRHRCLSIAFTDNTLPLGRRGRRVYRGLAALGKDLALFGEIRATVSRPTLEAMRAAGFDEVQIGIEALSTRLLAKINKGTSAMDNIAVLRACQQLGIRHRSNLILCLPGSDETDVAETLANLAFVQGFAPLHPVRFWLGLGSPIHQHPSAFGIRSVFNHRYWRYLFPETLLAGLPLSIQTYTAEQNRQRRLWAPVRRQLVQWRNNYRRLQCAHPGQAPLSWRDGGDFLIIRQHRPADRPATHRLGVGSRAIYLFCQTPRPFARICAEVPGQGPAAVRRFLDEMVAKKLMFTENDRYLSLAVPARGAG